MREFVKPALWLGIWIFGWLLCIVLSMITPPDIEIDISNGDKIGHFLAYGMLAAWAVMIFRQKRSWWLSAFGLICLGIVLELAQGYFTSNRMMDWRDALADTIGVGLGLCVSLLPMQRILLNLDRKIFQNK
ncbi:MAG: VanZ family protein [Arenimonas sp.]